MTKVELQIPKQDGSKLAAMLYHARLMQKSKPPLIILCHGFTGDKEEWGRFPKTAQALINANYDALLFDFSGSGSNPRQPVHLFKQVEDLEQVTSWAKREGYEKIGSIGLSFGGITSLLADIPDRNVAVFWAPGFFMKRIIGKVRMALAKFIIKITRTPLKRGASQGAILMGKQFFKDISEVDVEPILREFTTPSLIIQGLEDNSVKPDMTRDAFSMMPEDGDHRLLEIKGATHNFNGQELDKFISHTLNFLNEYLKIT